MSSYNHATEEPKWQRSWKDWKIYHFDPSSDAEIYSIDNPPRYTSGSLHLGHATGYPIIDFAARYRRMRGYNVFFPLCFDTNGMPVETATEKKYGITKFSVDRKTYLRLCSEYANQFIGTMTQQFEMLGMSLDSSIYYQTDSPDYRRLTQITFLRMLKGGLAYRGTFPVNWCPHCNTSLADAEVEREDRKSKLYYVEFPVRERDKITIATSRPELIGACQAILFKTGDKRYSELEGRNAVLPMYSREVPIIADDGVDAAYGSGAVMVCSYGDKEDVEWILRHRLPAVVIVDEFGKLNSYADFLSGLSAEEAREKMISLLKERGLITREEEIEQSVGVCWRCSNPVEIIEKKQWFLKSVEFRKQILQKADRLNWFPEFMKQRLKDWTESLNWDWVISRQRLFATPIPVWECTKCDDVVAADENECYVDPQETETGRICPRCNSELKGSRDVFDTWMDSSISVLYNTFWERNNSLFHRLFPMSLRAQAHEIIRTWTYYTLLRVFLLLDDIPWKDIMITGFIMAPDRTPMHTHLGNVIDPVPLIRKYGSDALRYYAATCSLGTDQAFRERDVVHGQRLCNKIWNIALFSSSFKIAAQSRRPRLRQTDMWILSLYSKSVKDATGHMEKYEFDKAMKVIEQFAWHDFADDYIEMVKKRAREGDEAAAWTLRTVSIGIVKLLAPFLPHVTEAVYQQFFKSVERSIHVSGWPMPVRIKKMDSSGVQKAVNIIHAVRDWRARNNFNGPLASIIVPLDSNETAYSASEIASACRASEVNFAQKGDYRKVISAIRPNYQYIGPRYREKAKEIVDVIKSLQPSAVTLNDDGSISCGDMIIEKEAFFLTYSYMAGGAEADAVQSGDVLLFIRK
ncbi:MAG: valine--tRNA ligase [Candidatus Thermoplasmatota archaeon]|jgi:valyl-tRNA synthetase|nr:valine--tRNA ligase [Candidatus Sysuiplasma jiujiangense]MCL4317061.1 valine--tRNA ligase [Candidatus Thermoplasmatota archaeon]MCL5253102.1 valine--tRNA ligase [Candidatus Thermoplasmatota archaeon]